MRKRLSFVIVVASLALATVQAWAVPVINTDFSTDPGWTSYGNTANYFGYNSNLDAIAFPGTGTNPGVFRYVPETHRYSKTLPQAITDAVAFDFSHDFDLVGIDQFGAGVLVGFFPSTVPNVQYLAGQDFTSNGLSLNYRTVSGDTSKLRLTIEMRLLDGTTKVSNIIELPKSVKYHTVLAYDPVTRKMTLTVTNANTAAAVGTTSVTMGVAQNFSFQEFGVGNREYRFGGNTSSISATIDNVVLNADIVIPEPASLGALTLAGLLLVGRRH